MIGYLDAKSTKACTPQTNHPTTTVPSQITVCYGYDGKGNRTSATYPAPLGGWQFTPDAVSRVTKTVDGKNQTTNYTFDPIDRTTEIDYADGSKVVQTFDADGDLTKMNDSTGTTTYKYDGLDRLISENPPSGDSFAYSYDGVGNLTGVTEISNGRNTAVTHYYYGSTNLLTSMVDQMNNTVDFGYDPKSNDRTSITYPNLVSEGLGYDTSHRLTSISAMKGSTTLTKFSYSCTQPGTGIDTNLRYSVTNGVSNVTTSYSYDALDRLTEAKASDGSTDDQYSYDGNGNLCRTDLQGCQGSSDPYQYNAASELTSSPGVSSYSYDGDGNETGSAAGASFTYNAQNQATSITAPGGSAQAMTYTGIGQTRRIQEGSTDFSYDVLGLRGITPGNTKTTTYLERDSSGNLVDEWSSSGGTDFYLTDGLGSVVGLTDSNGNLVNSYAYQPYGEPQGTPTQGVANAMQFAGYYNDTPIDLYKVGARYYDPSTGRWTQQDLINNAAGSPLSGQYAYASSDPVNLLDPSGQTIAGDWGGGCGTAYSCDRITASTTTAPPNYAPPEPAALPSTGGSYNPAPHPTNASQTCNVGQLFEGLDLFAEGAGAVGVGAAVAIYGAPTIVAIPLGAIIAVAGGGTLGLAGYYSVRESGCF